MSLIVEDGTAKTNAESYCTEVYADDYHEKRGNNTWNGVVDKEAALRKATDYIQQVYRQNWKGVRLTTTQALDWPRANVGIDAYTIVAQDVVPIEVKNACAELALKTYSDELYADIGQKVKRKKVDVIEIEYETASTQTKQYRAIDAMLAPYLLSSTGGFNVKTLRV
jgi:hypothetical protein